MISSEFLNIGKLPSSQWRIHIFQNSNFIWTFKFYYWQQILSMFSLKWKVCFAHFWENTFWILKSDSSQFLCHSFEQKWYPRKKAARSAPNSSNRTSASPRGTMYFSTQQKHFMRISYCVIQNITKMHTQVVRFNKINHFYSFIKDNCKWNGLFFLNCRCTAVKTYSERQQF